MAPRKPLDLKGYYRILKVSPEAPPDEIRLSYALVRQDANGPHLKRIEEAYETLKDPAKKAAYDREGFERPDPLKSPVTLAATVVVFIAILAAIYGPGYLRSRKSFQPGQTLVDVASGREFGSVVRFEDSHRFPQGSSTPAYLVRMPGAEGERWYPAYDLQASCEGR
ncbi:MAG: hypothetical protein HY049_15695 [Acidobacteria bacterium]|nr:hypothetical protein [Acidobacteriota bacterium]